MNSNRIMGAVLALAVGAVAGACGGAGAGADDADTVPATMDQPAPQASSSGAPYNVEQDFGNYRLTMPAVRRWYEAQERIYRAVGSNPALADEVDTSHLDHFAELEAHFNGIPEVRAAVRQSGLEMREYTAILGTLFYVRGVDAAIRSGADRAALLANQQVDPANLEFAEQNRSELDRLQSRLDALESSMQ